MPFNMPTFGGFQGATPPIMPQPQQQQVIDPRAQYEQQSLLADQLAQMASGYSGGGWGEALGDIIAAYRSKKQGQKAEGSLSAALEQEAKRAEEAMRAEQAQAQRQREQEMEDFRRREDYKRKNAPAPSSIREMRALGIEPNSPEGRAWMAQQSGPQSTVNVTTGEQGPRVGTIPQGFQLMQGEGGGYRMEPIPGSEPYADRRLEQEKAQGREQQTEIKQGIMTDDIARALEVVEDNPNLAAGPLSVVGQFLNIGPANRLESALETIKPNIAFDRLDEMRQNSPTGGAVGQLSDSEREALGSVLGSLRQTQNPEDLQYNLKRLNNILVDAQHGNPEQRQALVQSGQVPQELNAQIEALYMPLGLEAEEESDEDLINKYLR